MPLRRALTRLISTAILTRPWRMSVDWQDATCGSGSSIGTAASLATPYTPNAKDSVVIVQALYTYTPLFSTVLSGTFTMTRYAYARPRNGTTVIHS